MDKSNASVVIICGSESDFTWAKKISEPLQEQGITTELHAASAHKQGAKVLDIMNSADNKTIFVAIAGRSNALGGFLAGHSDNVVISCPPFSDKADYLVNIHSSLQMPSRTPALTILDPGNCVIAIERILAQRS